MVKGSEVLLVVPGVDGSVKAIGSHVGIGGLHGEVGQSTGSGDTSSHRHGLGVLEDQYVDQVLDRFSGTRLSDRTKRGVSILPCWWRKQS